VKGKSLPTRIARRLLHEVGLATAGDVTRAKREARSRARTEARSKRDEEQARAAARTRALLDARREQDIANHAERATLRKALAFHWERLNQLETLFGAHAERLELQLNAAIAARAAEPGSGDVDAGPGDDTRPLKIGGVEWFVPAQDENPDLPLDELAVSRQYAVGGAMLDIGAGFGQTSIPRALLGDFARVHAVEARDAWHRCLVANVAVSRVRGVVWPELVTGAFDLSDWLARQREPGAAVRFVRASAAHTSLELLGAGVELLPRRDVVWQLDLDAASPLVTEDGFAPLAAVIRKHFTHFKELGRYPAEPWRKAGEARRLFKRGAGSPPSGLLLFNLE
jgi:hypothetical protein